ncbi:MAG: hypothetical protein FD177_921 [Desulfovibrionaceae bacterium]|nr:MAG: hypothetical protein FD177_921 [Desulfovibrionaceae bacterium]
MTLRPMARKRPLRMVEPSKRHINRVLSSKRTFVLTNAIDSFRRNELEKYLMLF